MTIKNNTMVTQDLLPARLRSRKTGHLGYFNIWVGLAVILATFGVGGEAVYLVNMTQMIFASIVGCLILGILNTLGGDIGTEHGISYPTYMRAVFGSKGMLCMNILRTFYGAMWYGIQTYYGAIAINIIMRGFIGFDSWMVWFWVFSAVQVINTACGFKAIEKFANIAAPCILLIGIYMIVRMANIAEAQSIPIMNKILGSEAAAGTLRSVIYIMILNMCFWADGATDVETWTREVKTVAGERNFFKRNKYTLCGHLLGLTIAETFMVVIGAVSMIVFGNYNPIEAIEQMTNSPIVMAILLLMVIMAQWSTNNTANLLPGALCISSFGKGRIKFPVAVVIVGLLGFALQPWIVMDHIATFLSIIGSIWSSVLGLSFADYYLIRRRRINIPELYDPEKGQFLYAKGWNLAGVVSVIISLVCCYFASDFSIFVGLGVSFISYTLIGKLWFFKKYPQAETSATGDEFRGTSANREWLYSEEENRLYASEITAVESK